MTQSIDHNPEEPSRHDKSEELLEKVRKDTEHDDEFFDDKTNRIAIGISAAGLLGIAGALALRRLHRGRKE